MTRLESRYLDKNSTGLDMLEEVLWQPPCRFEFSPAKELFRLVTIMSRISSITLTNWYVSPALYGFAQYDDLS